MSLPGTEEIEQLQLERLQSTLNRAFRSVPFHRNRFSEAGIDPSEIEKRSDIDRIPFMERKHLGEYYPYGLFAVPLRDIVRIHTAPGTSLNPTVSGYTCQDLKHWREIAAQALKTAGVTAHDILQISLDPGLANWGRDYKDGAETLEASVIPNTVLSIEKQLMVLRDYKTSVLITTPGVALMLAEQTLTNGLNPTKLSLKTIILVGEPVDEKIRKLLEKNLHVTVWIHYGLSEVPGPAIAYECSHHEGLHVHQDHFLAEIVDPTTGKVLSEGEPGELILTTLTTRAFPLIRFRTGDRARIIPEVCPCGSSRLRIQWYPERVDEMICICGVKIHKDQLTLNLESALGYIPDQYLFSIIHSETGDKLKISIAVDDTLFSDEIKMLEKHMESVAARIRENIAVPVVVHLKEKRSF